MKRALATFALAALTVVAMAGAAFAQDSTVTYTGELNALNDSGASASATATVDESSGEVHVRIEGSGFAPALPHAQHIHGHTDGMSNTCPDSSADEDGDGFVSTAEGLPAYGDILVSLTTEGDTSADSGLAVERFPTYDDGVYERTFEIDSSIAADLGNLHMVIHGIDINDNGEYDAEAGPSSLDPALPLEATIPAVCGTLSASASGGVATGAGGTAHSDGGMNTFALAALGAMTIGGAAFGLRRRQTDNA